MNTSHGFLGLWNALLVSTILLFATPAGNEVRAQSAVQRGYLGATVDVLSNEELRSIDPSTEHALFVLHASDNSPAAAGGLQPGDVILQLNGQVIKTLPDYITTVQGTGAGRDLAVRLWRKGTVQALSIRLGTAPQLSPPPRHMRYLSQLDTMLALFPAQVHPHMRAFVHVHAVASVAASSADSEQVLSHAQAAVSLVSPDTAPSLWAKTHMLLAAAYVERMIGDREQNLERTRNALKIAEPFVSRERDPVLWAQFQLVSAHVAMRQNASAENINILDQIEPTKLPPELSVEVSLAKARAELGQRQSLELVRRIVADIEKALRQAHQTQNVRLQNQASTLLADALALLRHWSGSKGEALNRELALRRELHERASIDEAPQQYLLTAYKLGRTLIEVRDWVGAQVAFERARRAYAILARGVDGEADAGVLFDLAPNLFVDSALVAAELGAAHTAFTLLDEGKARVLAMALRQQRLELPLPQRARFDALKHEIGKLEDGIDRLQDGEKYSAVARLAQLRRELIALARGGTMGREQDPIALLDQIVPDGGALVAPIVSDWSAKLLVAARTNRKITVSVHSLPADTEKQHALITTGQPDTRTIVAYHLPDVAKYGFEARLGDTKRGPRRFGEPGRGWVGAFRLQYEPDEVKSKRLPEWFDAIEKIGSQLWPLIGDHIHSALVQRGVKAGSPLVLLPQGAFAVLPLGLAQDATGQRLADMYDIAVVPSLRAAALGLEQQHQQAPKTMAAVINPTGELAHLDLPFTELEGDYVAAQFQPGAVARLGKANADPKAVLDLLRGKTYWHFASHGFFDWADTRGSGLLMRNEEPLSIARLLSAEGTLGKPRLVVLSACETGLYDTARHPDEFTGLPTAFLQLGAAGVLSALWQVDDLATLFLIAKFYDMHLNEGHRPASALRLSQQWLRGATISELMAFAKAAGARAKLDEQVLSTLQGSLTSVRARSARFTESWKILQKRSGPEDAGRKTLPAENMTAPFAHPYYWGGFVYTGL